MVLVWHRKVVSSLTALIVFVLSGTTQANWFVDNDAAVGFEGGTLNYGLSMKLPASESAVWQLTANSGVGVNSFGGRYLSHFSEWNDARVYWYGGASIWTWGGNRVYGSETVIGVGAGFGLDYDLRKAGFEFPIAVNSTIGSSYVAFSNYSGLDLINIGFGLHYRFK